MIPIETKLAEVAPTNPNGVRYCVDGHEFPNEDSEMLGEGAYPPFLIFDIEAQDYLPHPYPSRNEAESELRRLEDNDAPLLPSDKPSSTGLRA